MNVPLLQVEQIGKIFHGIPVLTDVHLQLSAGSTMGIVGENGAGKSTLMNIIGGNLTPDSGRMQLAGDNYAPRTPRDAESAGVAFIHQELNLFPNLTIADNLFLTGYPRTTLSKFMLPRIDQRQLLLQSACLLELVGLSVSPKQRVETLSAGERQLVEIAKALQLKPRLIILDEPTTSLSFKERLRLFSLLDRLSNDGIAMLYISHALADVRRLCDAILVLRDGKVVGQGAVEEFNNDRLVSLMVGRESTQQFPQRSSQPSREIALQVENVSQPGTVKDITFSLRHGEVLGLSGLMGSGRTELARILFGLEPMSSGQIKLHGEHVSHLSVARRIEKGMAMLTESRRDDGLCMHASVESNMSLVVEPKFSRGPLGILSKARLAAELRQMKGKIQLDRNAQLKSPVQTLSGGNQQKVVLAKWLLNQPKLFILDEPTRGIDVGAKFEIYALIDQLAASGASILFISSELEELVGVCDRILVMRQGELKDELDRSEFDVDRIMHASLQANQENSA
ncbi:MAG: sugar ABC transporter ATP-binding protein [Planctomycetales bacterium]|nr:sugar ABC transporter ATP-binding protein [Planctomycetales bacterium]